jgi:hypothetical protein
MNSNQNEFESACLAAGIDLDTALAVRKALGEVAKIQPETLAFNTPTMEIVRQVDRVRWDGWDDMSFIIAFEELTGRTVEVPEIPRIVPGRFFLWKWPGAATLGEWLVDLVPVLIAATSREMGSDIQKSESGI